MILAAEDFGDLINFTVLLALPGVLVLAWLVGRLLGVRRSWTAMFNDLLQLFFTFGRGNFRARVSLFSDPHDEHVVTKLVNRTVLALAGGVVGLIGAILVGISGGPPFAGDTSLYEFFGYFSLFCSVVLIMRVIVSVLHDGVN